MAIAKATQKPNQTKEQTKLIAKGIEKGIAEYKKRNKEKARELDKKRKKLDLMSNQDDTDKSESDEVIENRSQSHYVLVVLLVASLLTNVWQYLNQ